MAGHKHNAFTHHLVGDGDSLFRIAGVIADLQRELLAEHAAGGIDVGNRLLGARFHLLAEAGVLTCHRPSSRNINLGLSRRYKH